MQFATAGLVSTGFPPSFPQWGISWQLRGCELWKTALGRTSPALAEGQTGRRRQVTRLLRSVTTFPGQMHCQHDKQTFWFSNGLGHQNGRWTPVFHRLSTARLLRLSVEKGETQEFCPVADFSSLGIDFPDFPPPTLRLPTFPTFRRRLRRSPFGLPRGFRCVDALGIGGEGVDHDPRRRHVVRRD